jgi:hypothetical protein
MKRKRAAKKTTAKKPSLDRKRAGGKSLPHEEAAKTSPGDPGSGGAGGEDAAAFRTAAAFVGRDESASARIASPEERRRKEQDRLVEWAEASGRVVASGEFESLSLISNSTSEHEVRRGPIPTCVWKRTWPGFYGQIPEWRGAKLERRSATPAEYLERMALQNETFNSGFQLIGVSISDAPSMIIGEKGGQPSVVIAQPFIQAASGGASPIPAEIATFFESHGFEPMPGSYFGWVRRRDGVAVVDARPDNLILSPFGVIPVDLQMARLPALLA